MEKDVKRVQVGGLVERGAEGTSMMCSGASFMDMSIDSAYILQVQ